MSNTAEDDLARRLNESLSLRRPWGIYTWVKVLVVYWDELEDSSAGFREEGQKVVHLFEELFRYNVEEFVIPLTCSARRMKQCILTVLNEAEELNANGKGPCLLILHYGGHGDRDDDHHQGQQRRSVWAASAEGDSAVVEWYTVQDELKDITTDVVLFLDCCFAAQAARAREVACGRIEMLAAAAMGVKTRLPGPRSFTHALVQSIRSHINQHGSVNISTLATAISKRELNLETPVHLTLRRGITDTSIRLVPFSEEGVTPDATRRHDAEPTLRLLVRASAKLKLEAVVLWLRSDLPPEIFSIQADEVLRTTSAIQGMTQNTSCDGRKPMQSLEPVDIDGLVATWSRVPSLLEQFSRRQEPDASQKLESSQESAKAFLASLKHVNESFIDVLEQRLLQSSQLDQDCSLEDLINDEHLQLLGIADQLRLRTIITGDSASLGLDQEEPPETIDNPQGHPSRVEFKDYGKGLDLDELSMVENRVHLLVELLNAPKSSDFRALKCVRWYHQPGKRRFVLEFAIPVVYLSPSGSYRSITLSEVIRQVGTRKRPNLGQRFGVAYMLARAVRKWHVLGWVHQSISSISTVFFYMGNDTIDYSALFLQGFDYARPNLKPSLGYYVEDVENNVYRHPDRQGPARQGHRKVHDLYSLGVVLLEIGLWELASKTAGAGRYRDLPTNTMQDNLKDAAINRLAHYAGKDYQEAVLACLEGSFGITVDDQAESQLAQAFQERVIQKLNSLTVLR